jgi:hypothetical protein
MSVSVVLLVVPTVNLHIPPARDQLSTFSTLHGALDDESRYDTRSILIKSGISVKHSGGDNVELQVKRKIIS